MRKISIRKRYSAQKIPKIVEFEIHQLFVKLPSTKYGPLLIIVNILRKHLAQYYGRKNEHVEQLMLNLTFIMTR